MAIVKQFKTLHCWCKTFRNNTKTSFKMNDSKG